MSLSVSIPKIGHILRDLMRTMESLMVSYDGTVRDGYGNLIQLCYGEDGFAGDRLEINKISSIMQVIIYYSQSIKKVLTDETGQDRKVKSYWINKLKTMRLQVA